ncbi:unnamed protein product, partial [Porites lobata]
ACSEHQGRHTCPLIDNSLAFEPRLESETGNTGFCPVGIQLQEGFPDRVVLQESSNELKEKKKKGQRPERRCLWINGTGESESRNSEKEGLPIVTRERVERIRKKREKMARGAEGDYSRDGYY